MMERPDKQAAADQVLTQLVPFLEHLREQGLSVGVDDYLRVHVLVQRLETEAAFEETESEAAEGLPPRLRSFLRPLFATTAAEQTKFDRAFASFRTRIALSDSVPPGARVDPTAREAERRQELAWRWKEVAEEKRRRQETELWEQSELRRKQAQQQAVRRRRKLVGALFIALLLFLLIPIGLLWFMRGNYHKSLERTIDFGTVKAKGAAFPTSEQPLFLNGSEQLPRAVRRYLAPRLRLAPGSSPVFQLTKGIAPGAYVLRFQPRQPTAYRARLRLDSLNPFDRLPEFQAEVTGDAILPGPAYHLTPEKKVDFGLHAVGATKRAPSVQLTLQQDAGAPFQPDALPRIEGTGAEHFHFVPRDLTQSFRAKRARHPFQVVFEPQPGAVGVLEAEVVYRSGERSSDPSNVVELTGQVPAIGQEVATATLTVEGEAIPGTRLPVRRPWWVAALAALLLLLPGLLLVRRLIGGWSRKEPPANPPFEWPLETDRGFTPFSASELGDTAALLAPPTRRQDPPGVFDAPASVRAAASAAGFARPRFRPHTGQPAGYVALIHRPSAEDLAAAYFRSMLRQLQRRGVPLELFYYRGNSIPTCWDEKGHAYPLSRIRKEYADRRLLIFGPADCLIDEGELKRWTGGSHPPAIFTLSSRPLTHIWDMPFPQFPGRLSGLRDAERRLPGAAETKPATAACAPEPPLPSEVLGARETAERLEHGYFRDDPRLFHWLCACARLPQVSWDLVLLFGLEVEAQGTTNRQSQARELEGGEPGEASFQKQANGRLVTEENLLRLLRLEWLREARIPQELRLELQRRLQTHRDLDAAIRQLLIRLLSRPPLPPAGSTASARLELELSVQAWIDDPARNARSLRSQLRKVPGHVLLTHPLLGWLLHSPEHDLWADVSPFRRDWMRRLFRSGVPRADHLRPAFPYTVLSLAALCLLASTAVAPIGTRTGPSPGQTVRFKQSEPASLEFVAAGPNVQRLAQVVVFNSRRSPVEVQLSVPGKEAEPSTIPEGASRVMELGLPDGFPSSGGAVTVSVMGRFNSAAPYSKAIRTVSVSQDDSPTPRFNPTSLTLASLDGRPSTWGATTLRSGPDLPPDIIPFLEVRGTRPAVFVLRVPNEGKVMGNERAVQVRYVPRENGVARRDTASLVYLDSRGQTVARASLTGLLKLKPPELVGLDGRRHYFRDGLRTDDLRLSVSVTLSGPAPPEGATIPISISSKNQKFLTRVVLGAGEKSAELNIANPIEFDGDNWAAEISATYQGKTVRRPLDFYGPWASTEPVITFGPAAKSSQLTAYSREVLSEILMRARLPGATIRFTARTPREQAAVMYDNLQRFGVEHQRGLYTGPGEQVIDLYVNLSSKKPPREEMITLMTKEIERIGSSRVTSHAADPKVLNVFDIGPESISNRAAFEQAVRLDKRVSKFLAPPLEVTYHLEIPQPTSGR